MKVTISYVADRDRKSLVLENVICTYQENNFYCCRAKNGSVAKIPLDSIACVAETEEVKK